MNFIRRKSVRVVAVVVVSIALVVVAGAMVVWTDPGTTRSAEQIMAKTRYEYQQSLNTSPRRFDPHTSVVLEDGRLYMRTDYAVITGHCEIRCGTVTKVGETYNVSLPVGYTHGHNVSPYPKSWEPVSSLKFWNPIDQQVETTDKVGASVVLPEFLRDHLKASELKPGQTAYTTAKHIRQDRRGQIYMIAYPLAREKLGKEFGQTLDTVVMRQQDGSFEVKLPWGVDPLIKGGAMNGDYAVPVTIVQ